MDFRCGVVLWELVGEWRLALLLGVVLWVGRCWEGQTGLMWVLSFPASCVVDCSWVYCSSCWVVVPGWGDCSKVVTDLDSSKAGWKSGVTDQLGFPTLGCLCCSWGCSCSLCTDDLEEHGCPLR